MVTREVVRGKLLPYMNGQRSLARIVDWAELTIVDAVLLPDEDVALLHDILARLATAEMLRLPLTWKIRSSFVEHPGFTILVWAVPVDAEYVPAQVDPW